MHKQSTQAIGDSTFWIYCLQALKAVLCAAATTTAADERKVSTAHPSARFVQGCLQHIAAPACSGVSSEMMRSSECLRQMLSLGGALGSGL